MDKILDFPIFRPHYLHHTTFKDLHFSQSTLSLTVGLTRNDATCVRISQERARLPSRFLDHNLPNRGLFSRKTAACQSRTTSKVLDRFSDLQSIQYRLCICKVCSAAVVHLLVQWSVFSLQSIIKPLID